MNHRSMEPQPYSRIRGRHPVPVSSSNRALWILAGAYLLFVIYGSLVPLDFRPKPIEQAIAEFQQIRVLNLGIGSRADWVANILLFVPLAFLWTGLLTSRSGGVGRVFLSVLVFAGCFCLTLGIEFTQLFFPPRTVSQNDIQAESIGAITGILFWWWKGQDISERLRRLPMIQGGATLAENALWIYLVLLFGYNLLPLDLTISPVELYHKWSDGRLILLPFSRFSEDIAHQTYNLITDILIWIPVSLLWVLSRRKSQSQAWHWALGAAVALEFLQLFIYSRVTDVTDILTAMTGAIIGSRLSGKGYSARVYLSSSPTFKRFWLGSTALGFWIAILCLIFWYPFDFIIESTFLRERLPLLYNVPFQTYYYGTEFRAVTELLHKVLFFAPLGIVLALIAEGLKTTALKNLSNAAALMVIVGVAFGIELGQVALPGKYPDNTDLLLESLGGLLGYFGTLFSLSRAGAKKTGEMGDNPPSQVRTAQRTDHSRTTIDNQAHSQDHRKTHAPPPAQAPTTASYAATAGPPPSITDNNPRLLSAIRKRKGTKPGISLSDGGYHVLFSLVVTSMIWLVVLSILPLNTALSPKTAGSEYSVAISWGEAAVQMLGALYENEAETQYRGVFSNVLLCILPAFFCFGAIQARTGRYFHPLLISCAVITALGVLSLTALYFQIKFSSRAISATHLYACLSGALLGVMAWWALQKSANRAMDAAFIAFARYQPAIPKFIVVLISCLILLPLNNDAALHDPGAYFHAHSTGNYLKGLPPQLYAAIKGFMIWIPLGLIFSLARLQGTLQLWTLAGFVSLLIMALTQASDLQIGDLVQASFAPAGIWMGLWLGQNTLLDNRDSQPKEKHRNSPSSLQQQLSKPSTGVQNSVQVAEITPPELSESATSELLCTEKVPSGSISVNRVATTSPLLPGRLFAAFLLIAATVQLLDFPRVGLLLGIGLAVYIFVLWRAPLAWLLVLPALLPVLDLAPWTGRFFFDGFDLVMIVTLAMVLWHGPSRTSTFSISRPLKYQMMFFGSILLMGTVIGLLPWQSIDQNAFNSYWNHFNSLRVAKGYLWAVALLLMLYWVQPSRSALRRLLVPGICLGLGGVLLVGLREHWQFAGLFNLDERYRITATFSSMHTGGGHIEAYLVMAIPLLWYQIGRTHNPMFKSLWLLVFALAIYTTTTTIARGGVLALVVALGILSLGNIRSYWLKKRTHNKGRLLPVLVLLLASGSLIAIGVSGSYFQSRIASIGEDLLTRLNHWRDAVEMMDDDTSTVIFGMGLGSFPLVYLQNHVEDDAPGTYQFRNENGSSFLRLGSGQTLYMAQRLSVKPQQNYILSMDLRSPDANARLDTPLCEKHLLNSLRCQWRSLSLGQKDQWQHYSIKLDSGELGEGNWFSRRSVELSLSNLVAGTIVDVANVQLIDDLGNNLINNGDFSDGSDYWFFKTHGHLPFHIKSLPVQLYFELGLIGMVAGLFLIGSLLRLISIRAWNGSGFAFAILASSLGFLTVGIFGSLFDAPRLTTLFFGMLLAGLYELSSTSSSQPPAIRENLRDA